jgi:glutamine amidotransferase
MVAIVDYGMGNLRSVERKLSQLSKNSVVTCDATTIEEADAIILPGVGHFGKAMEALKQRDLIHVLNTAVLEKKTPILGICLGMQLMTQGSEEGGRRGRERRGEGGQRERREGMRGNTTSSRSAPRSLAVFFMRCSAMRRAATSTRT